MTAAPSVLVFDVNETLIDIEALSPHFEQIFGDARVMREWFGQLVMYSMAVALSGCYVDFSTLGQGTLQMLGEIHGARISDEEMDSLKEAMMAMPAHPDVADGLAALRNNDFRLVTLTNSPPSQGGPGHWTGPDSAGTSSASSALTHVAPSNPPRMSTTTSAANWRSRQRTA